MRHAREPHGAAVEKIAALLERTAGLRFDGTLMRTLARAVAAAPATTTTAEYVERLARDDALLDDLIDRVTVRETYFFRGPAQFDLIRDTIVPRLLADQRGSEPERPLRFWSAGCATGEEAYTIAILLRDMGLSDRVWILGTDINPHAVAAAREGRYRSWSMRAIPDRALEKHFTKRGDLYHLDDRVRAMVDFRTLNLASSEYPSRALGVANFDVVLCRNVLIYLTAEGGQDVGRRLVASLRPGGWLLPGASDPRLTDIPDAFVDVTPAGLVYRRVLDSFLGTPPHRGPAERPSTGSSTGSEPVRLPEREPPVIDPLAFAPDLPAGTTGLRPSVRTSEPRPLDGPSAVPLRLVAEKKTAVLPPTHEASSVVQAIQHIEDGRPDLVVTQLFAGADDAAWHRLVKALADRGDVGSAGRIVGVALEHHPESAGLHLLNALVLTEADRLEDALQAARAALYLDDDCVLAHVTMGTVLERLGERRRALVSIENAVRLLEAMDPEGEVEGFDHEPAGSLLDRMRARLHAPGRVTQVSEGAR